MDSKTGHELLFILTEVLIIFLMAVLTDWETMHILKWMFYLAILCLPGMFLVLDN